MEAEATRKPLGPTKQNGHAKVVHTFIMFCDCMVQDAHTLYLHMCDVCGVHGMVCCRLKIFNNVVGFALVT